MNTGSGVAEATLVALEFPQTLETIAGLATCVPGKARVLASRPLASREAAELELRRAGDALAMADVGAEFGFGSVTDTSEPALRAAKGAALSGEELVGVARAETALAAAVKTIRAATEARDLHALTRGAADTRALIREIDAGLDKDGAVKDDASPELARIRRERKRLEDDVRQRCAALVRNPATAKLLSELVVTVRAGRYALPVRSECAADFPGVALDESASGATTYIEPLATVEANNRLRGLAAAETREVARILGRLSNLVGAQASELAANAELVAHLDSLGARARWARRVKAGIPQLTADCMLRIVAGRHPLLRRTPVPLDLTLGESFDVLVVSGPNMGGKSVALKTVGLFCALAYAGFPLPAAAGTTIGWFDRLACVLGDEQSIAADLSSFSAHLGALHGAQQDAGRGSLLLVDEIGSGTEPGAGAALAQAFIEAVAARGARVVVTTHFTQLKVFAAQTARVANASMLFDAATNEPTYVLAIGVPGQSLALRLASAIGMDAAMVARAAEILGAEAQSLEAAFEGLARERDALRRREQELRDAQTLADQNASALREQADALRHERERLHERAAAAIDAAVRDLRAELLEQAKSSQTASRRSAARLPGAQVTMDETLAQIRRSLGLERPEPGEPAGELRAGDQVYVDSLRSPATVSDVFEHDVLVTMGALKAVVQKTDVRLDRRPAPRGEFARSTAAAPEVATPSEIDVRGMRVDDAELEIDKALDAAALAGLSELRIIHGKGTGQLRAGVGRFLRDHPHVASSRMAEDRAGGSGATIVTLK